MTERTARLFVQLTGVLALASILAAGVLAMRWRHERDTFTRRLAEACEPRGP